MSGKSSPPFAPGNEVSEYGTKDNDKIALGQQDVSFENQSIGSGQDLLGQQDIDPALNAKMHLVNNVRKPTSANFHSSPNATSSCY
jgi:hypothetical protein